MALVNVNIIKYLIIAALISIIGIILINLYIPIFFDSKRNTVIQDKENQILFANLYQSDGWNGLQY